MSTAPTEPAPRHALGLPAGSVRALLAFGILLYLWVLVMQPGPDGEKPLAAKQAAQMFIYLQVLMVLILAHFFTAHGRNIGETASRRSPLGLPRGTVRFVLLAGYLGMAYYLYHQQLEFDLPKTGPVLLDLLLVVTAFFVGYVLTGLMRWVSGGVLPAWFQDVQAWFALIGLLLLGIILLVRLVINRDLPLPNQVDVQMLEIGLTAVVGFYFGARS